MAKNSKKQRASEFNIDEVYPNSPLIEVVCEIRFPGDTAIECKRDEYHNKIKDKYPLILVPHIKVGKPISTIPYRFENKDRNAGVMLAINKFSFYVKKYEGHKKFIKEFMRLTELFGKTYLISKLERIGWRYINILPFERENGLVPLQRFFNVTINVPCGVSDRFEDMSIAFVSQVEGGSVTTKIESVVRSDRQQEAWVLDFDFAMTEKLHFTKLSNYVKIAHQNTRRLFENLITDEYREYLRGNTL